MADQSTNVGGLPSAKIDVSKLPLYKAETGDIDDIRQAQKDAITALEDRYKDPNLYKVAAGFLKPQLGGFAASLGSASEAMGENFELNRAQKLPIAEYRVQIAQQNMLLNANRRATDYLNKIQSQGKSTHDPAVVAELERIAPEANVTKAAKAELAATHTEANIRIQRIQSALALKQNPNPDDLKWLDNHGMSRPSQEGSNVPTEGAKPPPSAEAQITATPAPATTNKEEPAKQLDRETFHVVNDAPGAQGPVTMLPDVYKLYQQGIPVISNFRSEDEKKALMDAGYMKDGKHYTAQGRPIATVSRHDTGDAIDLSTAKPLTPDQKRLLSDNGWRQTDPVNDSNHYERPANWSAPKKEEKAPEIYQESFPRPDVSSLDVAFRQGAIDDWTARTKAAETPVVERINNLTKMVTGEPYLKAKTNFDFVVNSLQEDPPRAQRVLGLLRQKAIMTALNEGIGVSLNGYNAQVHLPIEKILRTKISEDDQTYADKLFSSLLTAAMYVNKSEGVQMGGTPQQEYMKAMERFANSSSTPDAARSLVGHAKADFDYNKEYYEQFNKELKKNAVSKNTSATPYYDIQQNSDQLKVLERKFEIIKQSYNR
jgi:hypothetical protein